jgi:hypothetical protein
MTNSQRLATVRTRLLQWLAEEEGGTVTPRDSENGILRESILIRKEFYCGRSFHTAAHQAVWFIEEDELKIYRNNGELLCVLSGDQINVVEGAVKFEQEADHAHEPNLPNVIKLPAPVDRNGAGDGNRAGDAETRRAA